ncbi:hypothetical protein N0V88_006207 [Collariella sp. IMI 366227]|nr:hypothetical protein N0V88_006207 [Collariella sp. IMI 366227]
MSNESTANDAQDAVLRAKGPPLLSKIVYATKMYAVKGVLGTVGWLRDRKDSWSPPEGRPNIVKTYDCRPKLPVRIFFPSNYDQTSLTPISTLFTIHAGGFCIGHIRDDDEWNRAFADRHQTLLPSIRSHPLSPSAVISIYGAIDLSIPPTEKLANRPWKKGLLPAPRGGTSDYLLALADAFDWAYIPVGQDLRDPLLSPAHAEREKLPPFVCLVAAELDILAHDSWRLACRLSGRAVPDRRGGWEVGGWEGMRDMRLRRKG